MKRATVKALVLDKISNSPVVLLGIENSDKILPIWIGACEASIMAIAIEKVPFDRPLTHDLIVNLLTELSLKLDRFVIHSIRDNVFYAKIVLKDLAVSEQEIAEGLNPYLEIDARPSDCIILSLKTGAPLYVTNDIIASESISLTEGKNLDEGFKQFIDNLDINEFRKLLDEGTLQEGE
ncbi:MAG TPA: bifunctional nuclease family protein [Fervidobacterium sp.]|nr:bifunctional nuclease family protein [Fervidobacterium sp.]HOM74272.1 bifunctional nuclease family protein [Fervidobacterium sp.]HOQ39770.1 bifunctional nuclease family protein [Fervidobacterium sp.]HPP17924.1 bifunctional nuclease family protein [Fervidobacterium sp.]HPT54297.1 bifunctional nuclease family protein [Fervidobacterium sp.]